MFTSPRKLVRGLSLVVAVFAAVFSLATAVYASSIYPIGQCGNGYCYFLSCGSSAGNYYMKCNQATGVCDDRETDACNGSANEQCEMRGHSEHMTIEQ